MITWNLHNNAYGLHFNLKIEFCAVCFETHMLSGMIIFFKLRCNDGSFAAEKEEKIY